MFSFLKFFAAFCGNLLKMPLAAMASFLMKAFRDPGQHRPASVK